MHYEDTITACEYLVRRHAPLMMLVGEYLEESQTKKHRGNRRVPLYEQRKIAAAYAEGEHTEDIAIRHGLTVGTVRNIASKHGIKRSRV